MRKLKLVITESQMRLLLENTKLDGIKKVFDVIPQSELEKFSTKDISKLKDKTIVDDSGKKIEMKFLFDDEKNILATYKVEISEVMNPITNKMEERRKYRVRPSEYTFDKLNEIDPSEKKMYLQWLLKNFVDIIKSGVPQEAVRFIDEDLMMTKQYLEIFNDIRNDKKFKEELANVSDLPSDVTNILQYKNVTQLYRAVEPFIKKSGNVFKSLTEYVNDGKAKILYDDSNWLVYQPLTVEANCILHGITNICTGQLGNTNFDNYTRNYKEPNGSVSKIYVIFNKKFFKGTSDEIYQFHLETNQFRNRIQRDERGTSHRNFDWVSLLLSNPGLADFFKKIMKKLTKERSEVISRSRGNQIADNIYLQQLISLGDEEDLFNYLDVNSESLDLSSTKIRSLPEVINKFKNLKQLEIIGGEPKGELRKLPESIGDLVNLELITLSNNKLKDLPESIGKLKNLKFLIIDKNNITKLPNSITNLDSTNGGELLRLRIGVESLSPEELEKIKSLLPTVRIL